MLEQRDHRGHRFTIGDDEPTDVAAEQRARRGEALERDAQRQIQLTEEARAVAGAEGGDHS